MRQGWQHFIHETLKGTPDDPYVRLLREKLRTGSSVVRVHFEDTGTAPMYVVLLSLHRQLSEMRVPHSESFTRWSLESGTRMASAEDEAKRFALLLRERFAPVQKELGRESFESALLAELRMLAPPRTQGQLGDRRVLDLSEGRARGKAQAAIDSVLASLARELGASLKYDESQVAQLLDEALARYIADKR
jgi:hypothetical protein